MNPFKPAGFTSICQLMTLWCAQLSSKVFVVLVVLTSGGCSMGAISDSAPQNDAITPPANYEQLVADSSLVKTLGAISSAGPLEISELKKTVLSQPGEWMACLKTSDSGRPLYYAIFFRNGAILDARLSVFIDRCGEGQFSPLPHPTAPKPPLSKSEVSGKR